MMPIQNQVGRHIFCALVVMTAIHRGGMDEASAQAFESVGSRALGMGGAFVAVADDGSAVYWNPAGLATGPFFELRFERAWADQNSGPAASHFFSLSVPAMGLSYYKLRSIEADPQFLQVATTAQSVRDREIQRPVRLAPGSLVTHHFGLTLVHSVSDRVAVATTVRGMIGTASVRLDDSDVDMRTSGTFDLDAGVLGTFGHARIGVVVRNLRAPSFEIAGPEGTTPRTIDLRREVRVGVALMPDQGRRPNPTAVALDVDLTRQPAFAVAPAGQPASAKASAGQRGLRSERRNVAAGVEQWLMNRRLGVRAGVRASTLGDSRAVVTGGASVMVRPSMFVEGHAAGGRGDEARGWSLAARVSF